LSLKKDRKEKNSKDVAKENTNSTTISDKNEKRN